LNGIAAYSVGGSNNNIPIGTPAGNLPASAVPEQFQQNPGTGYNSNIEKENIEIAKFYLEEIFKKLNTGDILSSDNLAKKSRVEQEDLNNFTNKYSNISELSDKSLDGETVNFE